MRAAAVTLLLCVVTYVSQCRATSDSDTTARERREASTRRPDTSLEQKMDGQVMSFIEQILRCRRVPGLSVALVQGTDPDGNGEEVEETVRSVGNSNVELKEPVTPDTAFCLSSCTKAFTTTLLALLLHERGLNWDTPLNAILGDEELVHFPDARTTHTVTLRDLATHRTGMPAEDMLWYSGAATRHDIALRFKYLQPLFELRADVHYTNTMYVLLGLAVEKLGGGSWETLVTERLLVPLHMLNTTFFHHSRLRSSDTSMALQYVYTPDGRNVLLDKLKYSDVVDTIAPAMSVCSTGRDMARWMRFQLTGLTQSGRRLLDKDTLYQLHRPYVHADNLYTSQIRRPHFPVGFELDGYSHGWYTGHYRDWSIVSHHGWFPGLYTMVTLLPERNLAIFTAINGGRQLVPYSIVTLLHTYLLDVLLGVDQPWLDRATACNLPGEDLLTKQTQAREAEVRALIFNLTTDMDDIDTFVGCYWSPLYGPVVVNYSTNQTADTASLEMRLGSIVMALRPVGYGLQFYAVPPSDQWLMRPVHVTFTANDGLISGLQLPATLVRASFTRRSLDDCSSAATCCFTSLATLIVMLVVSVIYNVF